MATVFLLVLVGGRARGGAWKSGSLDVQSVLQLCRYDLNVERSHWSVRRDLAAAGRIQVQITDYREGGGRGRSPSRRTAGTEVDQGRLGAFAYVSTNDRQSTRRAAAVAPSS